MASGMEQIIEEMEEFIDGCGYQTFSSTKIVVNKDEMERLLMELKGKAPEEIKRCQKIVSNKEAILADAQSKAERIIEDAKLRADATVNEHEIMQQAYARANEVVMIAEKQAQDIRDSAVNDANNIRLGAIQYADDLLKSIETAISRSMEVSRARHESYMGSLQEFFDIVSANRAELNPSAAVIEQPVPDDDMDDFTEIDSLT